MGNVPHFLRYLTSQLHQRVPGGLVLWYDSVVSSGQLRWQDELNAQNRWACRRAAGLWAGLGAPAASQRRCLHSCPEGKRGRGQRCLVPQPPADRINAPSAKPGCAQGYVPQFVSRVRVLGDYLVPEAGSVQFVGSADAGA